MEPLFFFELLNGVVWIAGFFVLVYLILNRLDDKKKGDMERVEKKKS